MRFKISFVDGRAEIVSGADNYEQEGSMVTFFESGGRNDVDSWSTRLASFRTNDLASVQRVEEESGM